MDKVIVIAGPTATGKTALSVKLAKLFGGEVVSADSVQIYKGLNIGSAKPTEEEMQGVPHHMIDILEPDESYSVANYCAQTKEIIFQILSRGHVPILAGGTGLYISSLVNNVSFAEEKPDDKSVREELLKELLEKGKEAMHEKLALIDPDAAAAIHPNNTKRVIRALEVFEKTGKTLTEQNAASKKEKSPFHFILCALSCEREILYDRINRRVDQMVEEGLLEEVKALLAQGLSTSDQSMQGIGYKETVSFLEGALNWTECIEKIKQSSRNYAKRQLTWFRRGDYKWFDITSETLYEEIRSYIGEKLYE